MQDSVEQIIFLLIPLLLSGFIHLCNPVGYPDIFYDVVYIHHALNFLHSGNV